MSRKQLAEQMDAQEVYNWMSYEMSINPDKYDGFIKEIETERMKNMSLEEEARKIKEMFKSMGL